MVERPILRPGDTPPGYQYVASTGDMIPIETHGGDGICPTCGHSDFPKAKTLKPGKADQTPEAVPDLNAAIDKVEARLGGKRPGHWYTVFDVMNYLAYVATDEEIAGMVS